MKTSTFITLTVITVLTTQLDSTRSHYVKEFDSSTLSRSSLANINDVSSIIDVLAQQNQQFANYLQQINLLNNLVNVILQDSQNTIDELNAQLANAGDDVSSIVTVINSAFNADILTYDSTNDVINVNADGLQDVLLRLARRVIALSITDRWQQAIAIFKVKNDIRVAVNQLRPVLEQTGFSPEILLFIINNSNNRVRRDLNSEISPIIEIITQLLQQAVINVLTPIRNEITDNITNLTSTVLSLYVFEPPSNPLLAFSGQIINQGVMRIAQTLIELNNTVNIVFDNLLGTNVGIDTSIAKREVGNPVHDRMKRDIDLRALITAPLNKLVKSIVEKTLESNYANVGRLVLAPIEALIKYVIDQILPCGLQC